MTPMNIFGNSFWVVRSGDELTWCFDVTDIVCKLMLVVCISVHVVRVGIIFWENI